MTFPIDRFRSQNTPFYYYDMALLQRTLDAAKQAAAPYQGFRIHYAVKANADEPVLRAVAAAGIGADIVSGGELMAALQNGFEPERIVFAGVGKSDSEILAALDAGIGCFNVESLPELENIAALAEWRGTKARVALRVNPEIDAHTHKYITTGLAENKFGIAMERLDAVVDRVLELPSLTLEGLHFHIGSQLTDMEPYRMLCQRANELVERLETRGVTIRTINVGGGLGIDYNDPDANPIPDFKAYFDVFGSGLRRRPDQEVHFELGRSLVAQCGSLITKVIYVKEGVARKFAIVDAGMTDLIRPALYQAHHKIENITAPADAPIETYDVVGPICESSDTFGTDEHLRLTQRGDLLALRSAGAYGRIMASRYNCRELPGLLAL